MTEQVKKVLKNRKKLNRQQRNEITEKNLNIREHCNEKNLENSKGGRRGSNKRRDRNKQHEVENSKEQASIPKKDRNWK